MSPESSVGGMSLAGDSAQPSRSGSVSFSAPMRGPAPQAQPAPLQQQQQQQAQRPLQQQQQQKMQPGMPAAARLPFDLSQPGPIEIDTSLLYDAPSTTESHSGSTGDVGQANAESHPGWQPSRQEPGPSPQQGPGSKSRPGGRLQNGFNSRAGAVVEAGPAGRDVWELQQQPNSNGRPVRPASAPRERPLPRVTIPE